MKSIYELAVKLKEDVDRWEEEIFKQACSLAQEVAKALLENIDEELMKGKAQSLKAECLKERRIITVFGDISEGYIEIVMVSTVFFWMRRWDWIKVVM